MKKCFIVILFFLFSCVVAYGYSDDNVDRNPNSTWFEAGDRILKNYYEMERKRKEKFEKARKRQIEHMVKHAKEKMNKVYTESDDENYKFNLSDTGNCVTLEDI